MIQSLDHPLNQFFEQEVSLPSMGTRHQEFFASGRDKDEESDSDILVEEDVQDDIQEEIKDELRQPPRYAVLLLNDDYTTMEFVIEVLKTFFRKTEEEAMQVMLRVHHEGRGVAGVYSHDIAETKVFQVHQLAKSRGFPLQCAIEPVK